MRRSGNYETDNPLLDKSVEEVLVRQRLVAEQAFLNYHRNQSRETLEKFKQAMNGLHRAARTKWSASNNVEPPEFVVDEDSENKTISTVEELTPNQLRDLLDAYGRLYEKLNLHGRMKERSEDVGIGGKEFVQKHREDG